MSCIRANSIAITTYTTAFVRWHGLLCLVFMIWGVTSSPIRRQYCHIAVLPSSMLRHHGQDQYAASSKHCFAWLSPPNYLCKSSKLHFPARSCLAAYLGFMLHWAAQVWVHAVLCHKHCLNTLDCECAYAACAVCLQVWWRLHFSNTTRTLHDQTCPTSSPSAMQGTLVIAPASHPVVMNYICPKTAQGCCRARIGLMAGQ